MSENQDTIQSYEDNPEEYINSRGINEQKEFSAWIVDALDGMKNPTIFEIGSGPGYTADYLESIGYKVTRSDIVDKFIEFNRSRGKEITKHNAIDDEVAGRYDVVLAVNVMQHMNHSDMERSLGHIYRGLADDGKFLFTIVLGEDSEWHDDKGGARYFSAWNETELTDILVRTGFSVDSIEPINYKNWANVIVSREKSFDEKSKNRQIVDENDNLIGHKLGAEFDPSADIYRVSALWLTNSKGQVLLAQRSPKKKNGGGLWGPAVAGTVENDETYEQNIIKEAKEEIGLFGFEILGTSKIFFDTKNRKYFSTYFYATVDKPADDFILEEEVAAMKWVDADWLKNDVAQNPEAYVLGWDKNLGIIMKGAV